MNKIERMKAAAKAANANANAADTNTGDTNTTEDWKQEQYNALLQGLSDQDKDFEERGGHTKFGVINETEQSDTRLDQARLNTFFGENNWSLDDVYTATKFHYSNARLITAGDYAIKGAELSFSVGDTEMSFRFSNEMSKKIMASQLNGKNEFLFIIEESYMTKGDSPRQIYKFSVDV